jgi:hypothetical protein
LANTGHQLSRAREEHGKSGFVSGVQVVLCRSKTFKLRLSLGTMFVIYVSGLGRYRRQYFLKLHRFGSYCIDFAVALLAHLLSACFLTLMATRTKLLYDHMARW